MPRTLGAPHGSGFMQQTSLAGFKWFLGVGVAQLVLQSSAYVALLNSGGFVCWYVFSNMIGANQCQPWVLSLFDEGEELSVLGSFNAVALGSTSLKRINMFGATTRVGSTVVLH